MDLLDQYDPIVTIGCLNAIRFLHLSSTKTFPNDEDGPYHRCIDGLKTKKEDEVNT